MINETLARQAKQNVSFSDYKEGSATDEFNIEIERVRELIAKAKEKVSPATRERLDNLLASYTRKYASWINARNANGAGHASVMISGPAGFNHRQHEKYIAREGKLWEEYDELKNIDYKIQSIVRGDKIIKTGDPNALEKLQAKLQGLEENQEHMKRTNKIIRNKKLTADEKVAAMVETGISESAAIGLLRPDFCGRLGFPDYALKNNNAEIRRIKSRIEQVVRLQETPATEETFGEVKVVDNTDANRVQIFFPDKPSADVRATLKSSGFRWAPSIGAWQAYRKSYNLTKALEIAKSY